VYTCIGPTPAGTSPLWHNSDSASPEGDKNISLNLEGKENLMALDTGFVVAVLEGIESTLDELIECSRHPNSRPAWTCFRAG
jgi:hypothetical protein